MSRTMLLGMGLFVVAVLGVGAVTLRSRPASAVVQNTPAPSASGDEETRQKQFEQELARMQAEAAALEAARRAEDAAMAAAGRPTVEEYLAARATEDRVVEAQQHSQTEANIKAWDTRQTQLVKSAEEARRQAALEARERRRAEEKEQRQQELREAEVQAQIIAAQAAVEAAEARQREAAAAERRARAAEQDRWRSTNCTTNYYVDSAGRPYASTNCN